MAPARRLNIGEAPAALPQIRIHFWPTRAVAFRQVDNRMQNSRDKAGKAHPEMEVEGLPN